MSVARSELLTEGSYLLHWIRHPHRKILNSNGFIPLMTPTQALESIQVMVDNSPSWYDETTTRERINDVLDNVDAIHENIKGKHLAKEYHLKKEDEAIKHRRYMESLEETIIKFCEDTIKKQTADNERMRKILENTESNIRALKTTIKNLQEKAYQLTHKVLTNTGEKVKAITTMGKENMKESVPRDLSPTPFLGHLKEQMGSPYRTRETVSMIGNPKEIHNARAQEDKGDIDVGWDMERISKKKTKNGAKTTKLDTEWKSVEKTKSSQSPNLKKSTKVNPDKSKVKK
ncbi:hypothetical protein Tco_0537810 [Tanacetum coccineum]